jgi:antitoxin ParD1/3/4
MNVSLTPELEQYVSRKVKSGDYHSASEVIRDGLRLLKERDAVHKARIAELRREIAIGAAQADKGMLSEFNQQTLDEITNEVRQELSAERRRVRRA